MGDDTDLEAAEEREGSGREFRKLLNVRPVAVNELETPELLSMGANQRQDVGSIRTGGDDIQWCASNALESSFYEGTAPVYTKVQLRPQRGVLSEGPAPVAAHRTRMDHVQFAREVGGDKAEDIHRETVCRNK
jgi:hypothetical protein